MSSVGIRLPPLRKLTVLMDVPSPYRLHFFRSLSERLCERAIELHVFFMAKSVPIRYWNFNESDFSYNYSFSFGIHLHIKQHSFHFNPGIILTLLRHPPDWLVLGGSWNMPTTVMCIKALHLLRRKTSLVLWAEANFRSSTSHGQLFGCLRNWVTKDVDAYAVPGNIARTTLSDYWNAPIKPFISLPNLVDEKTFNSKVQSLRAKRDEIRAYFNLNDENFVLFWPARLHEPTKGIVSFLEKVRDLIPSNLKILIAGEGPDRKLISRFVKNADLDSSVILLGQKTQDEMVELYSISDAFMLPSLKDPNPLSVIEALWSGLPIFISIGCGNHPEAVEERVNGWVISHEDTDALRIAFTEMIGQTKREREVFGSKSFKLANERFATNVCIERFIDEITCLK